jgi:hypothetical protein
LHVNAPTADGGIILIQSGTLTNNNRAALMMSATNVNGQTGNVSIECIHPNNQQSDMVFRTGATDATSFGTERMRINTSGNVGIGTSSISSVLYVAGGTNDTLFRVGNTNAVGTQYLSLFANGAEAQYNSVNTQNAVYGSHIFTSQNNAGTVERARIDSSGNLIVGNTTAYGIINGYTAQGGTRLSLIHGSAGSYPKVSGISFGLASTSLTVSNNGGTTAFTGGAGIYANNTASSGNPTELVFWVNDSGSPAEAARITSNGNLLVGTTTNFNSDPNWRQTIQSSLHCLGLKTTASTLYVNQSNWHASTSGNPTFIEFATETTFTARGSISYNRAGGLVAYNTTSDYRAKDISGPIPNSGALIDSVPVYMGKMHGATQERPMFIAHETPPYAHTGEKDAVDADGNPVYQQMDASALIPVMWAEIQSLRKRLADAGI